VREEQMDFVYRMGVDSPDNVPNIGKSVNLVKFAGVNKGEEQHFWRRHNVVRWSPGFNIEI